MTWDYKGFIREHSREVGLSVLAGCAFLAGYMVRGGGESSTSEDYSLRQQPKVISAFLSKDEDTGNHGLLLKLRDHSKEGLKSKDGVFFYSPKDVAEKETASLIDALTQEQAEREMSSD